MRMVSCGVAGGEEPKVRGIRITTSRYHFLLSESVQSREALGRAFRSRACWQPLLYYMLYDCRYIWFVRHDDHDNPSNPALSTTFTRSPLACRSSRLSTPRTYIFTPESIHLSTFSLVLCNLFPPSRLCYTMPSPARSPFRFTMPQ